MSLNISYPELISWMEAVEKNELKHDLAAQKTATPATELLIGLIENCRQLVKPLDMEEPQTALSYSEIDGLLIRLLATPTQTDARLFWTQLRYIPGFFKKLTQRLERIAAVVSEAEAQSIVDAYGGLPSQSMADLLKHIPTLSAPRITPLLQSEKTGMQETVQGRFSWQRWVAAAAAVLVIGFVGYWQFSEPENGYVGMYNERLPYEFSRFELVPMEKLRSQSGLRTPMQTPKGNYQALAAVMTTSREYYEQFHYKQMVTSLKNFEPVAAVLQKQVGAESTLTEAEQTFVNESRKLLQEYYFTMGIAHLALSTDNSVSMGREEREASQQNAFQNFETARSIAESFLIDTQSREVYCMGLAQKYLGETAAAKTLFEQVPLESMFFEQAQQQLSGL